MPMHSSLNRRWTVNARRALLVALGLVAAAFALPVHAQAPSTPLVRSGLSEPVQGWVRAVETADIAAIRKMNGADTTAYVPDAMVLKGTEEIAAAYAGMFEKFTAKVAIRDARYLEANGVVHSWGLYTLTLTPRQGGTPVVLDGRFSDIATKVKGEWQYIMDHASLPAKN